MTAHVTFNCFYSAPRLFGTHSTCTFNKCMNSTFYTIVVVQDTQSCWLYSALSSLRLSPPTTCPVTPHFSHRVIHSSDRVAVRIATGGPQPHTRVPRITALTTPMSVLRSVPWPLGAQASRCGRMCPTLQLRVPLVVFS